MFGLWAVVLLVALVRLTPAGRPPSTTSTTPSTTPSRCSSSSSWRSPRRGRSSGSPRRAATRREPRAAATPAAWWVTILIIGPLLGSFITEPAAMTICALLLGAAVLRPAAEHALKYATLGPAVRQRVDRRHADALRRAARPDGGAPLGLGSRRSCSGTSAGGRSLAIVVSTAHLLPGRSGASSRAARIVPPVPDVDEPEDPGGTTSGCCRFPRGSPPSHIGLHGVDGAHGALPGAVRRRLPVLPRLRRRPRPRTRAGSS